MSTHNLTHLHDNFVVQRQVTITIQVIGSMVQSLKYTYINVYTVCTELHGRVSITLASYSGVPGFKSELGEVIRVLPQSRQAKAKVVLKIMRNRFFPCNFYFIIN
jgi:hypothetical protein